MSSAVTLGAGTLLSTDDTYQAIGSLAGAGTLALGDFGQLAAGLDGTNTTFTGTITGGAGSTFIKTGAGTMTFTDATIDADLLVLDEGTLALGSDLTVAGFAMGGGSGDTHLDLGSSTMTLVGGSFLSGIVGGTVSGSGSLHLTDNADLQLLAFTGAQLTHTGATIVDGNAYFGLFGDGATNGQSSLEINDNALVEIEGANTVTALSGNGGELALCFCATLTVNQNIDTTFAGNITDDGGGVLVKAGTGRLTLTGTNTYAGGTVVSGGVLEGTTNSLQGDILNNATVEFNQDGNGTYAGEMSGSGALVKSGAGTVSLTAANSYTGGTTITGGTLVADADGALGLGALTVNEARLYVNVSQTVTSLTGTDNAAIIFGSAQALTVDQSSDTTYSGLLMGEGALVKDGAGTLTLSGRSFYTGGTTVSGGRLVGNAYSLQGDILNNAAVEFDQTDSAGVYFGTMSGTGSLTASGNGLLLLGNANSYTGGTTLTGGGMLIAGADGALGNGALNVEEGVLFVGSETATSLTGGANSAILIDGTLEINQSSDTTYNGVIVGNAFVKSGTGTLTFDGGLVETTDLTVSGGTLVAASDNVLGSFTLLHVGDAGVIFGGDQELRGLDVDALGSVDLNDNGLNLWSFGGTTTSTMAGTLSGAGGSLGIFAGVDLTITGQATYTGATTLALDGHLTLAGDQRLSAQTTLGIFDSAVLSLQGNQTVAGLSGFGGGIELGAGSALTIDQDTNSGYYGDIIGGATSSFVKDGSGRLELWGNNAYGGGTTVLGGVLAGTAVSLTGNILNNAEVEFLQFVDGTYAGDMSGTGTLTKTGFGTLTLTGANSYTGGTTVMFGRLAGSTMSLQGDIANSGEVEFAQAADGTYAGEMSGTGALIKSGDGTLTLTGANSYTGGTLIEAGTLAGDSNSLQGTILNLGTAVVFNQAASGAFNGSLFGSGSLVKNGAGTLVLNGPNYYLGGTFITEGTLVGDSTSLLGDISNDGLLVFQQDTEGYYFGNISGSGTLSKLGAGTLYMFDSVNTYTGGTAVDEGRLVGNAASLQGEIANNATVEFAQYEDGVYAGAMSGIGAFVKSGTGLLELTGANTYSGGTTVFDGTLRGTTLSLQGAIVNNATVSFVDAGAATYAGLMSGTGTLAMDGTGTLTLTGANTYSGGTSINSGTVRLGANNAIGSGTALVMGTLDLAGFNATIAGLDGDGSVTLGTGTIDIGWNGSDSLFEGVISGAGSLVKTGTGTLTLTGANTYTGGTSVLGGVLAGDTVSLQGAIDNGAQVLFDQDTNGTFGGLIAGSGSVVKLGGGVLTLSRGQDYTGGTFVMEGTLAGAADVLNGSIVNNATVRFVQSGEGLFDGVISGSGNVVVRGGGTVVFDGANSYAGGTTIDGSTLRISSDAGLGASPGAVTFLGGTLETSSPFLSSRDFILAGNGTFDGDDEAALSGSISGSGAFIKRGSGILALLGTASHTGGTEVLEGGLLGTTASLQGSIRNQALVIFDQEENGTFDGVIRGSGNVAKIGAGVLTVEGVQTYTGFTEVGEGTLMLTGSLAGSVFVDPAGTLAGSGSVGGDVFVNGTLVGGGFGSSAKLAVAGGGAAGALAQPIAIAGDLDLTSSSTYRTAVGAGGAISTLEVGGTATIDGATLALVDGGEFGTARRVTSTVLTADAVNGSFGAVTGLDDVFESFILSNGTSIDLLMLNKTVDFSALGQTFNASGAGAALETLQGGAGGDLALVLRELRALETDAEVSTALDRISGSAHASFAGLTMISAADVIDTLTSRFQGPGGWWTEGLGSNLTLGSEVDPAQSTSKMKGVVAGFDKHWIRGMAGVSGGYNDSDIEGHAGLDTANGRAYRAAAYGEYRIGRIVVDGIVEGASHRVRGGRAIDFAARLDPSLGGGFLFGGVNRSAAFEYHATEIAAVADAGYALDVAGFTVQPAVGMQLTRISREAFTETGADSLDLSAGAATASSVAGRVRLSVDRRFSMSPRFWLAPRASVRYTRELTDGDVPFTAALAGASFTAEGFALPQSLFAAKAGLVAGTGTFSFSVDYRAAFAAGHRHHLLTAGIGF
jgi:autotransporter-associated beta strand protein